MAEQPRLVAVYGFSFDENQREFWQILGLEHMLDDSESDDDSENDKTLRKISDKRRAILKFLKNAPFDPEEKHVLHLPNEDYSSGANFLPVRDHMFSL